MASINEKNNWDVEIVSSGSDVETIGSSSLVSYESDKFIRRDSDEISESDDESVLTRYSVISKKKLVQDKKKEKRVKANRYAIYDTMTKVNRLNEVSSVCSNKLNRLVEEDEGTEASPRSTKCLPDRRKYAKEVARTKLQPAVNHWQNDTSGNSTVGDSSSIRNITRVRSGVKSNHSTTDVYFLQDQATMDDDNMTLKTDYHLEEACKVIGSPFWRHLQIATEQEAFNILNIRPWCTAAANAATTAAELGESKEIAHAVSEAVLKISEGVVENKFDTLRPYIAMTAEAGSNAVLTNGGTPYSAAAVSASILMSLNSILIDPTLVQNVLWKKEAREGKNVEVVFVSKKKGNQSAYSDDENDKEIKKTRKSLFFRRKKKSKALSDNELTEEKRRKKQKDEGRTGKIARKKSKPSAEVEKNVAQEKHTPAPLNDGATYVSEVTYEEKKDDNTLGGDSNSKKSGFSFGRKSKNSGADASIASESVRQPIPEEPDNETKDEIMKKYQEKEELALKKASEKKSSVKTEPKSKSRASENSYEKSMDTENYQRSKKSSSTKKVKSEEKNKSSGKSLFSFKKSKPLAEKQIDNKQDNQGASEPYVLRMNPADLKQEENSLSKTDDFDLVSRNLEETPKKSKFFVRKKK